MSGLEQIFRWFHIFAGVMWIGLLYFFNFINGQFAATLDAESKKKAIPELAPRALFWFRWGAAWTWITGFLLLLIVFYHGKYVLEDQDTGWQTGTIVMVIVTFLAVFIYDALFKSGLGKNTKVVIPIAFVIIAVIIYLMATWGGFSYRGYNIHLGAMFGTMMAFNVWFRIWPAQQRIITAIKNGQAPDPADAGLAGMRSKHNTYMSMPLFWAMINSHTTFFAGNNWGIPPQFAWCVLLVVIILGWHVIWQCYKKAGKVKGF
jgi:uncharacterized membrane protein